MSAAASRSQRKSKVNGVHALTGWNARGRLTGHDRYEDVIVVLWMTRNSAEPATSYPYVKNTKTFKATKVKTRQTYKIISFYYSSAGNQDSG